jgi:hypothetical protein
MQVKIYIKFYTSVAWSPCCFLKFLCFLIIHWEQKLLVPLFVLLLNHQNPHLGLTALTLYYMKAPVSTVVLRHFFTKKPFHFLWINRSASDAASSKPRTLTWRNSLPHIVFTRTHPSLSIRTSMPLSPTVDLDPTGTPYLHPDPATHVTVTVARMPHDPISPRCRCLQPTNLCRDGSSPRACHNCGPLRVCRSRSTFAAPAQRASRVPWPSATPTQPRSRSPTDPAAHAARMVA